MVWVEENDEVEVFENEDAACAANSNFVDEGKVPIISNPNLYNSSGQFHKSTKL